MRRYCITNWSQYNTALIERGNINIWFSQDAIGKWLHKGKRTNGHPRLYSDDAILMALVVREVFRLPLRTLQGFLRSMMQKLGLNLPVPSYTQICRRAIALKKVLQKLGKMSKRLPQDIVFDSTGLKVYGEGEWKVRQHGISKRRTWRKFHIGIDPSSLEIITMELTHNGKADAHVAEEMLKQTPNSVKRVIGDKAYDRFRFRRCVHKRGATNGTPPSRNAKVHYKTEDPGVLERNAAITEIACLGGDDLARKLWKKLTGYHKRSLVETTMYRIKQLFGDRLRSRNMEQQYVESYIKCLVLNKMTNIGLPKGYWKEVA
jgi:hypothetical protein